MRGYSRSAISLPAPRMRTEATGEVISEERQAYRKALDRLLDDERAELRKRFDERLERLDKLLGTFARTELHAWPTTAAPTN